MNKSLHFFILFTHLVSLAFGGQCELSALVSFQDCENFCIQKYGTDPQKQRLFYNMKKEKCQKRVDCGDKLHRMFENRCVRMFEETIIGSVKVPIPQIHLHIIQVVIHGNKMIKELDKKCYPGFTSSRKRKKIQKQVFEELLCDIPIGSDPYNYPQSHGQYFFTRLTTSQQIESAKSVLESDFPFDFFSFFLLIIETMIVLTMIRHHGKKCKDERQNE